jgi:hypothetical protein
MIESDIHEIAKGEKAVIANSLAEIQDYPFF